MKKLSQEEINKLVQLQLGSKSVKEHDKLVQDLGAESADVANIVAAAEEKYQIIIQESEISKINTPKDLYSLVSSKLYD